MQTYHAVLLFITSFLIFILGLVVFLRNIRGKLNLYYLLFTLSTAIWVATNAVFQLGYYQYLISLLSYGAAGFTALFTLLFILKFTNRYKASNARYSTVIGAIISIVSMVPGVVARGVEDGAIVTAPSLYVYGAYLITYLGTCIVLLVIKYRNSMGSDKIRSGLILSGFLAAISFGVFFNLALPLFGNYRFVHIGPAFTLILVGCIAYAVIKHRLFDIRLVVARSVAYILSILALGLIYGFTVFGFIDQFFPNTRTTVLQQAIYTLLAVFMAFSFQPLKRFFDKLTNRVFYQDRYNTEEVLNKLGKIFVSKSNSFELLDESLGVIRNSLKPNFAHLIIIDGGEIYKTAHIGERLSKDITAKDLKRFKGQLTVFDEVQEPNLRRDLLRGSGVYVVLRLNVQNELIGYLLLGSKQSGTIYTQQDINFLEILSQELAVAIQNAKSYEKIQAFSETLKKEIMEATAKLRETNKRLRKLDEAKDEFISMASHQLRTPLTTIKGYLSMLLDGDAGKLPRKQREFIDLAFVSSQRMVHLIADMLNVSRISTGKLTIDKTPFNLAEVVKSEIGQLERQAETRGVELNLRQPEDADIQVNLDEGKLRQVIMNFVDNAIYYSPKGKVDVCLEKIADSIEFKVVDNGIGISKEAQKQLFNKFFRAENAQHIRPDGTGLGLYMARQVIEAQDGEIIFSSRKGIGSTFGFRFNLEDQPADQPAGQ